MRVLHAQHLTHAAVAERLNAEGWHPAKCRDTFNAPMIKTLLAAQGLISRRHYHSDAIKERAANEWTVAELAHQLAIPQTTVSNWLRKGWLQGRQVMQKARRVWLIQADETELVRLRGLRSR